VREAHPRFCPTLRRKKNAADSLIRFLSGGLHSVTSPAVFLWQDFSVASVGVWKAQRDESPQPELLQGFIARKIRPTSDTPGTHGPGNLLSLVQAE